MRVSLKYPVPIMSGRAKSFDGRISFNHLGGHGFSGGIGIKTTINFTTFFQQYCFTDKHGFIEFQ